MKKIKWWALLAFLVLLGAYSNHFDNGFEFDDSHTIVNNTYIRDIRNIPLFFTDIKYYGTNPGNQSYNPLLTTLNAIDYYLGKGLNPVAFHIHIFFWYIVQLILMFKIYKKILSFTGASQDLIIWTAFLSTAFYSIHAANAETINYIIMRSDSFSAMCIVLAMVLYIWEKSRKWHLYLIPAVAGILTKEIGAMFAPLLFIYVFVFEEDGSFLRLLKFKGWQKFFHALKKTFPAWIVCFGLFAWIRIRFMPADTDLFKPATTAGNWEYFYTQWVVIAHYIGNFILPLDLSADPDFEIFSTWINRKVIFALFLHLGLIGFAIYATELKKMKPIGFGILWFYVTLAPTSSIIPFGQIANDHRTFLPYIGLMIAAGWGGALIYDYLVNIKQLQAIKKVFFTLLSIIYVLHAYGTYQRNIVWGDSELLWKDVTEKSPGNGRGWMNYGLILMSRGHLDEAERCFQKTLERMPYWAYIHINMGILKEAQGKPFEAEQYFLNAIRFQPEVPDSYYYYARFLMQQGRIDEARQWIAKGLEYSPGHVKLSEMKQVLEKITDPLKSFEEMERVALNSKDVNKLIEIGLNYYHRKMFEKCIDIHLKALALDSNNAIIYNNICSAYIELQQYDTAIEYCKKALKLDPGFTRAQNNLKWALSKKNLH